MLFRLKWNHAKQATANSDEHKAALLTTDLDGTSQEKTFNIKRTKDNFNRQEIYLTKVKNYNHKHTYKQTPTHTHTHTHTLRNKYNFSFSRNLYFAIKFKQRLWICRSWQYNFFFIRSMTVDYYEGQSGNSKSQAS